MKHCLIFFCLISLCYGEEESITECIPISQCDQFQWISNHNQALPNFDLNQLNCGYSFEMNEHMALATRTGMQECRGYLKIHYLESGSRLRALKLRRKLRKIARKEFYRISVNGNCCWRLYEKSHFRGYNQHLTPGFDNMPEFQFSSAKIVEC